MVIHEVSSDMEPRWVTMPFSGEPVERSAMRKPFSIASSVTKTATTSPMPKMASSVTFQRWRRLRTLYVSGRAIDISANRAISN